jgi:mono/diheme cytochrome c family protein
LENNARLAVTFLAVLGFSTFLMFPSLKAQSSRFHDAPASADESKNPYAGQQAAAEAGGKTYAANCAGCHGQTGKGTGNIPALAGGPAQTANDGELFWFITNGTATTACPPGSSSRTNSAGSW